MSRNRKRGVYKHARGHQLFDNHQDFAPVRKVVRRTTKRVVGRFPSSKSDKMVSWESQVERDFLYLLEVDPDVVDFVEQPVRMRLVIDGDIHFYVPDLLVRGYHGQSWIVEVKTDEEAGRAENKALFAAAAEACLQRNFGYLVQVESWIRQEPRLSNAKFVCRYRRVEPGIDVVTQVVSVLERRTASLGELRERFGYTEVMALLLKGVVAVDFEQLLTDASPVWLPDQGGLE